MRKFHPSILAWVVVAGPIACGDTNNDDAASSDDTDETGEESSTTDGISGSASTTVATTTTSSSGSSDTGSTSSSSSSSTGDTSSSGTTTETSSSSDSESSSTTGSTSDTSGTGEETGEDTGDTGTDATSDTGDSEHCPIAGDLGVGDHIKTIMWDGEERTFMVHVPPNYDPNTATPLLLNLHGLISTAEMQVQLSNMNPTSDAAGYVVLYPTGTGNSWNAGTCCGDGSSSMRDDVGFLRAMIEEVEETMLCIDHRRIYATGMSNGGYMSYRLGCEMSDVFAAIAPVAGALAYTECSPPRPLPVMAFHGVQDTIVTYASDVDAVSRWVEWNGCDTTPVQEDFDGGNCQTYSGCDAGVEVEFCTLDPMGHCWPGGDPALCVAFIQGAYSDAIDANSHMLEFFSRYTLP